MSAQDINYNDFEEEGTMKNIEGTPVTQENKNDKNFNLSSEDVDDETAADSLIKKTKNDGNAQQDIQEFMDTEIKSAATDDSTAKPEEKEPAADNNKVYLVTQHKTISLGEDVSIEMSLPDDKKAPSIDELKKKIPDFSEKFYAALKGIDEQNKSTCISFINKIAEIGLEKLEELDDEVDGLITSNILSIDMIGVIGIINVLSQKYHIEDQKAMLYYIITIFADLKIDLKALNIESLLNKDDAELIRSISANPIKKLANENNMNDIMNNGLIERRMLLGIA
jgi:hypothetical protein